MDHAPKYRIAPLVAFWGGNLILVAVAVRIARQAESPFNFSYGDPEWIVKLVMAWVYGWMLLLPLVAASCLALAPLAWWRRPLVSLGLMLSLEYLTWLLREEGLETRYFGDISLMFWLPFLSAAVIWSVMALLGRWRTVLVEEEQTPVRKPQFALWEMFVWMVIVGALVWPVQNMVVSWQRESTQMFDKLFIIIIGMLSLVVIPPLTMFVACVVRMCLNVGRSSWAIRITLALIVTGFAIWGGYAWYESEQALEQVAIPAMFVLGVVTHTLLLGYFLRSLGYRVESRSWWARR